MKQLTKLSNFFIFGIALALFLIIQPQQKFSLKLSSMLTGEDKKFYKLTEQFSYVNTFLVATKGLSKEDLKKLVKIKKELLANPLIKENKRLNNKFFQDYKNKYKFYLNELNYKSASEVNTKEKLQSLYNSLISSTFYVNINKQDPLSIIKQNKNPKIKTKNGHLVLANYGYLSVFTLGVKADEKSRIKIYDEIHKILDKYEDIKYFTPIFFYVENSKVIQGDVQNIIAASMVLLGILYILILRNIYLFINVATTLATSVIAGQIVITFIYTDVSIIALAFSTAITSVSIDYMFHHYLHNHYNKRKRFNMSVFYGFLTTISAFTIISFIDFPLIRQISIFTIVSLTVAYIHFAFIYPHLGIKHKEPYIQENYKTPFSFSSAKIIFFSTMVIIISIFSLKFDFNIKNLDYKNTKLINTEAFFKSNLSQKKQAAILISSRNINNLIENAKLVKQIDPTATVSLANLLSAVEYIEKQNNIHRFDFEKLKTDINIYAKEVGFKDGYFDNAYSNKLLYPVYANYTVKQIKEFGIDIVKDKDNYITYALVSYDKLDEVLALDFTTSAQAKVLFENSLKRVNTDLILYGSLTLIFIIIILALVTKKRFLKAFTYIAFPASLIILYGIFVPLNIMHIFMAFVIMAIGIDYGIYMNEPKLSHNTTLAIIYSLISTFAGFGVLIISNINSLYSIAITAIIGILGILFLLLFQKRSKKRITK